MELLLLIIAPPLVFGGIAFLVGRWQPVVAVAVTLWGALLVAVFASGGGEFGPWLAVGPWFALVTVSVAGAVTGALLRGLSRRPSERGGERSNAGRRRTPASRVEREQTGMRSR